ncbi:outer membrane protein assembly factor BamB [Halioxenophilus sp. WMMB6]|uniref:outer membrane protein assembly factor BamB n=1 Tax=Halioxenophilus sp. WMMB6 TaxID=3073815 RepID=UPI00295E5C35|nr:outer membrane protein assembly factor BamB [Halioxenophilus sp. WMMB6]
MRLLLMFAALLALAGCSSSGELKPSPLVDVDNQIVFKKVWSRDTGGGQDQRYTLLKPAFANGQVYAMDIDGRVSAYAAETGKRLWRSKLKLETSGGVGAYEKYLAVGTYDGEVVLLSAETGEEVWRQQVSTEVLSAPQLNSELVVVHTIDGKLHGISIATGEKLWQYDNTHPALTSRGSSTPIVTETLVVAAFDNGKLIALNPDNGIGQWDQRVAIPSGRTELERMVDIDGSPLMVGDLIFAASLQGRLVAISRATGRGLWARDTSTYQNLASNGLAVFLTTADDTIQAYNVGNGEDVWTNEQMLRRQLTGPAYVQGLVMTADSEGYLHVLDASSGEYLGRKKINGSGIRSPLVVMGDKVLIFSNDGDLYLYSVTRKSES